MTLDDVEISDPTFESEGLRHLTVRSPALGGRGDITLFVPDLEKTQAKKKLPLVVLLHGVYGSHWAWALKGGVHRTAARLIKEKRIPPMILAMPSDGLFRDGSGYLPHKHANYEKWILEDVPAATSLATELIEVDRPFYLGGLSMGGYGALRLGGLHPERIAAVSAHSSVTSLDEIAKFTQAIPGPNDLKEPGKHSVLAAWSGNRRQPTPLRFDCGLDDPLLSVNRTLHKDFTDLGLPHEYAEFPGGHEWDYWAKHIEITLLFFGGKEEYLSS